MLRSSHTDEPPSRRNATHAALSHDVWSAHIDSKLRLGAPENAISSDHESLDPGQNRLIAEMLDSFGDAFMVFDLDWRVTHCNRGAAAHYGLSREDMIGRVAWTLPGMGEDSALRDFLERALATGAAVDAEVVSELHPGRWFYLRAFPLQGGLGLSSRDVTDRHEQTRREREQAERLDLALATAGFGDWSWDPGTDLVTLSPRAAQMTGASPDLVLTWTEQLNYLHPDDRAAAAEAVVKALA